MFWKPRCLRNKDAGPTFALLMTVTEAFYPYPIQKQSLYDGSEIAFIEKGSGKNTLLFIHGLSGNLLGWHKNFEELARMNHCVAVDLPGNGLSANSPTGDYNLQYFARCILDFIGQRNLQNVCLVGHSMGGQIALLAALDAPLAIQKLVLIAPAGLEQFSTWEQATAHTAFFLADFLQRPEDSMKQFYEQAFYRTPQASRRMLEACLEDYQRHGSVAYRKMLTQCMNGMFQQTVFENLANVKQPTLMIFGEQDALIPNRLWHPHLSVKNLGEMAGRVMPDARTQVFPRAGHFVHWESADSVNAAIEAFVD